MTYIHLQEHRNHMLNKSFGSFNHRKEGEEDVVSSLSNLLCLCEQSRIYCDIAKQRTSDQELQVLLRVMEDERNLMIIELTRYLRAQGHNPRNFFGSVFRKRDAWEADNCPAEYAGLMESLYLSEKEMTRLLSELEGTTISLRLEELIRKSVSKTRKIRRNLSARLKILNQ